MKNKDLQEEESQNAQAGVFLMCSKEKTRERIKRSIQVVMFECAL
jgi:hypothetical protein